MVWDYHAILLLKAKETSNAVLGQCADNQHEERGVSGLNGKDGAGSWVYDFDTSITPVPCPWNGKPSADFVPRAFKN